MRNAQPLNILWSYNMSLYQEQQESIFSLIGESDPQDRAWFLNNRVYANLLKSAIATYQNHLVNNLIFNNNMAELNRPITQENVDRQSALEAMDLAFINEFAGRCTDKTISAKEQTDFFWNGLSPERGFTNDEASRIPLLAASLRLDKAHVEAMMLAERAERMEAASTFKSEIELRTKSAMKFDNKMPFNPDTALELKIAEKVTGYIAGRIKYLEDNIVKQSSFRIRQWASELESLRATLHTSETLAHTISTGIEGEADFDEHAEVVQEQQRLDTNDNGLNGTDDDIMPEATCDIEGATQGA